MTNRDIPAGGAFASNLVVKGRKKIRFMYRERPDNDYDSGWRFFSGQEDQVYADNPSNFAIYALTTIAEIDPDIVPFLGSPAPCAFERAGDDKPFKEARGFEFKPEGN